MSDPYSDVYNAVFTVMKNITAVTDIVELKNMLDYSTKTTESRPVNANSDLPALELVVTDLTTKPGMTSTFTKVEMTFGLNSAAGSRRVTAEHLPLLWALTSVVYRLRYGGLKDLTVGPTNEKYVHDVEHPTGTSSQMGTVEGKSIPGWLSNWSIVVHMHIPNTALQDMIDA